MRDYVILSLLLCTMDKLIPANPLCHSFCRKEKGSRDFVNTNTDTTSTLTRASSGK